MFFSLTDNLNPKNTQSQSSCVTVITAFPVFFPLLKTCHTNIHLNVANNSPPFLLLTRKCPARTIESHSAFFRHAQTHRGHTESAHYVSTSDDGKETSRTALIRYHKSTAVSITAALNKYLPIQRMNREQRKNRESYMN